MEKQFVLEKLGKSSDLSHIKQAHALLTTLGHSQTQLCAFKLVRAAAISAAGLSYAAVIFDRLASPNVYLYAAIITANALHRRHLAAVDLFRRMLRRADCRPNHFVYPQLLKSAAEALPPRAAGSVHAHIVKTGFGQQPVVQTGLVGFYAAGPAGLGCARKVFDEISERSAVTWTVMVSGYIRVGDAGNAMALFEEMPARARDVPSWNAVISGSAQNGLFSVAISMFGRMMEDGGLGPNGVTVSSVLSACGHTGSLRLGRSVHAYVNRTGLTFDSFLSNALIDMYAKCGKLTEARRVFDTAGPKRSSSWNSMINGYALHGRVENAVRLFEQMINRENENEVKPDEVTFIGLLNACTHGGLTEEGIGYFGLMSKYAIKPRVEHYGCLIDLLGRARRFDQAVEVIKGMEFEPDEAVWGSLLNGCKIHGQLGSAEFALQRLIEIDPNNGGYFSELANIYGELGKWDEARKLRKILKEKKAYKTPGCSWIEIDQRVWHFHSSHSSHPRTKEIYSFLEDLLHFMTKPYVELLIVEC